MKATAFMRKAESSLGAARLLLENGYTDEASSRAYYAMFDAARAAVIAVRAPVEAEVARSHGGLISAFARHVVKPGLVTTAIGRTFGQAQHIRLIADYRGDPVGAKDAARMIAWATAFVAAIVEVLRSKAGVADE